MKNIRAGILFFVFLFLGSLNSQCQGIETDSLKIGLKYFKQKKFQASIDHWSSRLGDLKGETDSLSILLAYALAEVGDKHKSVDLIAKIIDRNPSVLAYVYAGHIYKLNETDYNQAIDFFKKALSSPGGASPIVISSAYNGIGETYTRIHDYNNATYWRRKYLSFVLKNYGDEDEKTAIAYNNLSIIQYYKTNFDSAVYFLDKSLKVYEKLGMQEESFLSYRNMGVYYLNLTELDLAKDYLRLSLKNGLLENDPLDSKLTRIYYYLGCVFFYDQKLDSATYYLEKSIVSNVKDTSQNQFPLLSNIRSFERWLYSVWRYGQVKARQGNWEEARKIFYYADSILTDYSYYSKSRLDKLIHSGVIELLYFTALDEAIKVSNSEASNYFFRKSKMHNYNNAFRVNKLQSIPDSIRRITHDLELELLKELRQEETLESKRKLDSIYSIYNQSLLSIEPEMTKSIGEIQMDMSGQHAIVNYFIFEYENELTLLSEKKDSFLNNIFCLLITKDSWDIFRLPSSTELENILEKYKWSIDHRMDDDTILKIDFNSLGKYLLKEPLTRLTRDVSELIIIPDGILSGIPFELLPDMEGNMLIENYSVRYGITLKNLFSTDKGNIVKSINAFVPEYNSNSKDIDFPISFSKLVRSGEHYLPGAVKEVDLIASLFNIVVKNESSKSQFLETIDTKDITHFSGHAITDIEDPLHSYLALDNSTKGYDFLDIENILENSVSNEMVVLSACQTGLIPVKEVPSVIKTEVSNIRSIQSIGNAFIRSGAKSVLSTRWKIPDETSPEIISEFYLNLKKGMNKSEALRQSKLTYLKNQKDPLKLNPYYWAGFVLIGDDGPIIFEEENHFFIYYWWIFLLAIVLFFGIKRISGR